MGEEEENTSKTAFQDPTLISLPVKGMVGMTNIKGTPWAKPPGEGDRIYRNLEKPVTLSSSEQTAIHGVIDADNPVVTNDPQVDGFKHDEQKWHSHTRTCGLCARMYSMEQALWKHWILAHHISPAIKHSVCKNCDSMLIDGSTWTNELKTRAKVARKNGRCVG